MKSSDAPAAIEAHIASFPEAVRAVLEKIDATVRKAAPKAEGRISYRMPAYFQDGVLVYFTAFKKHIGLFPPVRGDDSLVKAVAPYAGPKGNLQFPLDEPIPYALITKIVKARLKANGAKAAAVNSDAVKRAAASSRRAKG